MAETVEIKCAHCGDASVDIDYAEGTDAGTGEIKLICACYKCHRETRVTVIAVECEKA